jgi:hypothetical protein
MNEVAKLLSILLSATVAALLVHDLLDLGRAHARDVPLPALAEGIFYD